MDTRTIRSLKTAVLLPLLICTSALAADPPPADVAGTLLKLHQSNQKEIQMGLDGKEQAGSPALKEFCETLISDHTRADEKVAVLARKKNVELPSAPPEAAKHTMPEGASFDEHFTKMMVEDHKKDIDEVKSMHEKATDPEVKELLAEMLPTLEKHLATAEGLQEKQEKNDKKE